MTELTREQLALCEKHLEINVHDSWAECTMEYWAEQLEEYGVDVGKRQVKLMNGTTRTEPAIYWSGFWSQGDGACFEGRLDMAKFITYHRLDKDYPGVAFMVAKGELYCHITQSGHYYNSGNTRFDFEDHINCEALDPVREGVYNAMADLFEQEYTGFESAVKDICRGYMDDIYEALELEYDHLTSDEAVWDSIVANELDHEVEEDEEEIAEPA